MGSPRFDTNVSETASMVFGVPDFEPEMRLTLPTNEMRANLREFLTPKQWGHHSRAFPSSTTSNKDSSDADVTLVFTGVNVTCVDSDLMQFHAPVMVRITATVRNASNKTIGISDMPHLYCGETNEVISCVMDDWVIAPGMISKVVYSIVARDAYSCWFILYAGENESMELPRIAGLNGLSELISRTIEQHLDNTRINREALANEIFKDADKAKRMIDRVFYVMDGGECFHIDPGCGNSFHGYSIRAKDAYRAGYRPCMKCVGVDWWRVPRTISSAQAYCLTTCSGEIIARWDYTDYDFAF